MSGNLKNFNQLYIHRNFLSNGKDGLVRTLSSLFNCNVEFIVDPLSKLNERYEIDITDNVYRDCYIINDDEVLLICRIMKANQVQAVMAIVLKGYLISKYGAKASLFNKLAATITNALSHSFNLGFQDAINVFNENLVKKFILRIFSVGAYNYDNFSYLVTLISSLRNTTFENKSFSTGFIITRSNYAYRGKNNHYRFGEFLKLNSSYSISDSQITNKRFWFMVDGKNSFYLTDQNLRINSIYNIVSSQQIIEQHINSYSLSKTLMGSDVVFRTLGQNQYSIMNSDGLEFINVENNWKMRDYNALILLLKDFITEDESILNSLIYHILRCSQSNQSSIIWIPKEIESIDDFLRTKHKLVKEKVKIDDAEKTEIIQRHLSSDGTTIITKMGELLYYACIVDINKVTFTGVTGTGENAASLLSRNGVSIKISQDGNIKIFYDADSPPITF